MVFKNSSQMFLNKPLVLLAVAIRYLIPNKVKFKISVNFGKL